MPDNTEEEDDDPDPTDPLEQPLTFAEHKDQTAGDCIAIAGILTDLANQVREGNMDAFDRFWIEGGTEEGDAKICDIRERVVLRYLVRRNRVAQTNEPRKDPAGNPGEPAQPTGQAV